MITRISEIMQTKGYNPNSFATKLRMNPQTVGKYLKGENKVSLDFVTRIVCTFDDIDANWLITGVGEMYKDNSCAAKVKRGFNKVIDDITLPTTTYDEVEEVKPQDGVPYYDDEYACGITACYDDNRHPDYYIKIKGMEKATFFCNASGDSMAPLISNGDVVGLQRISGSYIPLGEIYAIESDEEDIATIKRLRKGSTPDTYLLEPLNPDFDAYEIPKALISRIYKVVGCIKSF